MNDSIQHGKKTLIRLSFCPGGSFLMPLNNMEDNGLLYFHSTSCSIERALKEKVMMGFGVGLSIAQSELYYYSQGITPNEWKYNFRSTRLKNLELPVFLRFYYGQRESSLRWLACGIRASYRIDANSEVTIWNAKQGSNGVWATDYGSKQMYQTTGIDNQYRPFRFSADVSTGSDFLIGNGIKLFVGLQTSIGLSNMLDGKLLIREGRYPKVTNGVTQETEMKTMMHGFNLQFGVCF
ncbi:MAG: outer membrane beta-barrel protein [Flavobacteriales bacterium]